MIQIGIHTDNWRPLSVGFEAACEKIAPTGIKHIEGFPYSMYAKDLVRGFMYGGMRDRILG